MKNLLSGAMCVLAASALVVISGCGEKYTGPPLEPCAGTVTLDDKPLEGASINMANSQKTCSARSDAEGKWEMKTGQGPKEYNGAPLGDFTVTVMKTESPNIGMEDPGEEATEEQRAAYEAKMTEHMMKNPDPISLIPEVYASPTKSPLKITVEKGGKTDHVLELKSN